MEKYKKKTRIIIFSILSSFIFLFPITSYAQNIDNGKLIYKRCAACHYVDKEANKVGPSLKNIMGREVGTKQGFRYSPAMTKAGESGLVWTKEILKQYLHDPRGMIKGTRMASVRIADDADIDDLIAYMKSFDTKTDEGNK